MSMDLTGISNQNEFYTQHYLAAIFEQDLKERLQAWARQAEENKIRPPYELLGALRRDFFALQEQLPRMRSAAELLDKQKTLLQQLLGCLGYNWRENIKTTEDGCFPVVGEVCRTDGSPLLWLVAVAGDPREVNDPLNTALIKEQYPEGLEPKTLLLEADLEELITRQVFTAAEPPRWLLVFNINTLILIDRSKWSEKRMLRFDLKEILDRREPSTLKAMAALLCREHVCPESGTSLLDTLDENSHKHAFSVSEDLKYAAREAVELLGNEAIHYIKEVSKDKVYKLDEDLAGQLTEEALRYLYRLLFLFYLESRSDKLGYIPMKNEVYKTGYSLDSLRELEMTPLHTPEAQNGYFFDKSIHILFKLIADGVKPENQQEFGFEVPLHDEFRIERMESHLFDLERTPLLKKVKIRNKVWQQIIRLLSLTRETEGRNLRRGRVSYAQLGIIQLGAVYEGLLSYRGFFAETDLYEVKKAGEEWNPLQQAFFVPAEALPQYAEDEKVLDKNEHLLKYDKGTFIYRLAGRDREKSASYYTPASLTKCLVKYALKELIGEKKDDPNWKSADEILNLTVCEPAMGSAAFLNEAVNQLADAYLRRKQEELDKWIQHDKIEEETQKVRMVLADRNVFGIDLNPIAVELAEISLWLNSIHAGHFVPWFGCQLQCGNSLIGARRQVFDSSLVRKGQRGDPSWLDHAPERVMPGTSRRRTSIYHFLLPDPGMADYTDKVIKTMAAEQLKAIKTWQNEFKKPFADTDVLLLEKLSFAIDRLWAEHAAQLRDIRTETTDTFPFFGHDKVAKKETPLHLKDRRLRQEIYSDNIKNSSPYRRLKMVMDYWCALWFWPIKQAALLPSRDAFLLELQYILEGSPMQEFGAFEPDGQLLLFPDTTPRQQQLDLAEKLGYVDIDSLCKEFPRLELVSQLAGQQRFLHWELEFADLFADRSGFDLVLGNPPWVKIEWNESGLLSDYQPLFAVKDLDASSVAELRDETINQFDLEDAYFAEYEAITGTQNYLNAFCNYPLLKNVQTNLFKCFLPQAWMVVNANGVSGFVHPEGVYDDPHGGRFREELYPRLRDHFQFQNELSLFADVDHHMKFSINIFAEKQTAPKFIHIASLFAIITIDESMQTYSSEPVVGIKTDDNKWNTTGHPDRVIHVSEMELILFAKLYDAPGTSFTAARLPSVYSIQILEVLRKFAAYNKRLGNLSEEYYSTEMWHETNAVKKDHTIRRDTQFPQSPDTLILSGPHFYVGNPYNKTPREICEANSHYDVIDLTVMPANYLPRTNYVPDCSSEEYRRRTPSAPWDETVEKKVTDYYRVSFRSMLPPTNERTLSTAIIINKFGHINTASSISFRKLDILLDFAASSFSLVEDFLVKTTGKPKADPSLLAILPIIRENVSLRIRTELLCCLTCYYSELWQDCWNPKFTQCAWAKNDPRLANNTFSKLTGKWQWEYALRTDYERRQALVEIDVLVARALGLTVEELCAIYRIQFPVLKQNENDTWYDRNGRIVFTCSKGLPGVGFSRPEWDGIKSMQSGTLSRTVVDNWLPNGGERVITYAAPFDRCDREADYRTAWEYFDEIEAKSL